jgi:hypothetical protein
MSINLKSNESVCVECLLCMVAVSHAESIQTSTTMLMKGIPEKKMKGATTEYETPVKNAIGLCAYAWFE